jgi:prepilin-type processing-associated H-X9-DG protein
MYVQDYDERFPPTWYSTEDLKEERVWVWNVQPYIKNWQIWQCPSEPASGITDSHPTGGCFIPSNYMMNCEVRKSYGSDGRNWGANSMLARIAYPAELIMLGDYRMGRRYPYLRWCQRPEYRHNEGANLGFVDGHAKWLKSPIHRVNTNDTVLKWWMMGQPKGGIP